jgi:spore germination protein KC
VGDSPLQNAVKWSDLLMIIYLKYKKIHEIIVTALIFCFLLSFTGCLGKKELGDISIVTIIGIDRVDDATLKVSILAVTPSGNPQITTSEQSNVWLGSATGKNVSDAVRNLNSTANKKLVWFHVKYIFISAMCAKKNMGGIIDYLCRGREIRFSSRLLITEGAALDMLHVPSDVEKDLSEEMIASAENAEEWSNAYLPDFKELASNISEKDTDSIIGKIWYYNTPENTYSVSRQESRKEYWLDRALSVVTIEGSSVLKGDRFVGFLSQKETRGCLWIMNRVKEGSIAVSKNNGKDNLAVDIIRSSCKVSPEIIGNKICMKISLQVGAGLNETSINFDSLNEKDVKKFESLIEEELKSEMKAGLEKTLIDYDTDVCGFKNYIKRKYPAKWKNIEKEWYDKLPEVEVSYKVDVTLQRFGDMSDPIFDKNEPSNNLNDGK